MGLAKRASKDVKKRAVPPVKTWSKQVMETSDALDLESGVFLGADPRAIAASLKRSAERSKRRKAEPFRSAMSMLVFYINRAGNTLSPARRRTLEKAKDELRVLFGRPVSSPRESSSPRAAASQTVSRRRSPARARSGPATRGSAAPARPRAGARGCSAASARR